MKKAIIVINIIFLNSLFCIGQNMVPAPADKAVIYFVRAELGFLIHFSYFDSAKLIGRFNGPKYIRYECEPGPHHFWAKAENMDFIEADVEAGKIYFIEAVSTGLLSTCVGLHPIDPKDEKKLAKLLRLLDRKPSETFTAKEIENDTKELADVITRGLEKNKKQREKGKTIKRLKKTMYYNNQ